MGSLSNSAPLRIARHADGNAYLKGTVDEIELFNRVLTPSEIEAIYQASSAGKCKVDENRNFDARIELTEGVHIPPSETQLAAEAQLREEFPSLAVTYERTTGSVRTPYNMTGSLSGENTGDHETIALEYVNAHLDLLGLSEADLVDMEVTDSVYSEVRQAASGIPVGIRHHPSVQPRAEQLPAGKAAVQ